MHRPTLLSKTIALAHATPATIAEICEATGLKQRWYAKLKSGQIKDPGVDKVERLHAYLSRRAKEVAEEAGDGAA